jgi:2-keto-3-deoxy-L-rhamnonate aldolase RhmA
MMDVREDFARDLRARKCVVGTFIKSNDPSIVEILGHAGFDFAILDAEHAAFDRSDVALMAIAARAAGLALFVRIPEPTSAWITTVLDAGCAGVMVPQVSSAADASELVRKMHYGAGGLGFSPSTAGAVYGTRGIADHLEQQPRETVLICQIEDSVAVGEADNIASVEGVDGLLLGPVDLSVSIGSVDPASTDVMALCENAITAGADSGKAAGLFLTDPAQRARWEATGATIFVLGSDQAFLMGAAKGALAAFRN